MKEYVPGSTGPAFIDVGPRKASTFDQVKLATPWRENLVPEAGQVTYRHPDGWGSVSDPLTGKQVAQVVRQGRERPRQLGSLSDQALEADVVSRDDLRAMEAWGREQATLAGQGVREKRERAEGEAFAWFAADGHDNRYA